MSGLFSDDITWCSESDCPVVACYWNQARMYDKTGLHSFAMYKGTQDCPVIAKEEGCINGCLHAKECFAKHDDPDEALQELMDLYCDNCAFSSMEED